MLKQLTIRQFATIDALDIDLRDGFSVLTGETGAGKSILIDAIGLLLGDRADAQMVRSGSDRAELCAEFDLSKTSGLRQWLADSALDDPDDPGLCLVRRVISAEGRSRAFVNGSSAPIGTLRELGEQLVDVHGQHDHQLLLRSAHQRALLDAYGNVDAELEQVRTLADEYAQLGRRLREAEAAGARPEAEMQLLRYQADELAAVDLDPERLSSIDDEHQSLSHAGELLSRGAAVVEAIDGDGDALTDRIGHLQHDIADLRRLHPSLSTVEELLDAAGIQVKEAASTLRDELERVEIEPQRLEALERELERLHDLARKHRVEMTALPELRDRLTDDLERATDAAGAATRLAAERDAVRENYREAAAALHAARAAAADKLTAAASAAARELGMAAASLVWVVEADAEAEPARHGTDEVRIDFSANPGQAAKPLARIASGGELSRVSLAIQVVASHERTLPVMIFDEVDSGVGGAVAEIVGGKLRELAHGRQVLCVTHLPQVAAQAHHQYRIEKVAGDDSTQTHVMELDDAARVEEIARMLGGVTITQQTREHARDMLSQADA